MGKSLRDNRSNFEIAKFVEPGGEDSRGSRSGEGVQKHHIRKRGWGEGGEFWSRRESR